MPISLPVDADANELLTRSALALLIAMLLDQQVPLERAFSAPEPDKDTLLAEIAAAAAAATTSAAE